MSKRVRFCTSAAGTMGLSTLPTEPKYQSVVSPVVSWVRPII
ncbi:hypothetical protein [Megasphaera massiliensis]|nr:hypothetical protein [Megasphaera massiliensis]